MKCRHYFVRRPWWFLHRVRWMRWECTICGHTTRTYDTVDRWMTRPVHAHMDVAYPGFNTGTR